MTEIVQFFVIAGLLAFIGDRLTDIKRAIENQGR